MEAMPCWRDVLPTWHLEAAGGYLSTTGRRRFIPLPKHEHHPSLQLFPTTLSFPSLLFSHHPTPLHVHSSHFVPLFSFLPVRGRVVPYLSPFRTVTWVWLSRQPLPTGGGGQCSWAPSPASRHVTIRTIKGGPPACCGPFPLS